ncbi:MAG: outer membrane beta-barrel protein [Dysgonomonas sp.]
MKKLFFTLAVVLGAFSVSNAQEVGQIWVGGNVGVWHSSVKDGDDFTSYKIIPELGYVVSENIGVGLNLGYLHSEGADGFNDLGNVSANSTDADGFTVSPFLRYTFLKGDLGGLFFDGGVGYTYLKNNNTDIKTNAFEVGFRPGVAFKVSDKVSLTGKFGFLGYEYQKKGDVKVNSFGLNFDMSQFQLGANIVF